jgi:hypothetical protein
MSDTRNKLAFMAAIAVTGLVTHKALAEAWEAKTERPPPLNPAAPGVSWGEALLWGAIAGVVAGLGKTLVRRGLANALQKNPPPDL